MSSQNEKVRARRVTTSQDIEDAFESDPVKFVRQIVTGDEMWVHHYDRRAKSSRWVDAVETCFIPSYKEVQNSTLFWETHGDHFWDSKGLLLIDYSVPASQDYKEWTALHQPAVEAPWRHQGEMTRNADGRSLAVAQQRFTSPWLPRRLFMTVASYSLTTLHTVLTRLPVTIFCSAVWSLTFVVSTILMMKRSRKLPRSGWRDRQKISILVELTVWWKNVTDALVIILKNKVLFVTFPFFFIVELQNFLNAPHN